MEYERANVAELLLKAILIMIIKVEYMCVYVYKYILIF